MSSENISEIYKKLSQLEEEYTLVLNKYLEIEKALKRYNLNPSDLLSVEKLHQFLRSHKNSDVVWLMDLKGKSTFVSSSIFNFTGFTEKEYLAQSIDDRFVLESAEKAKSVLFYRINDFKEQLTHDQNISFNIELEYKCKDGTTKWGELNVTPVFDENGNFVALNGLTKDISAQIKNKVLISQQEAQFTNLLEHIPNMIFIHQNNELVYGNKAGRDALFVSNIDDSKIDIFSRVKPEYKPLVFSMIEKRARGESIEDYEIEVLDGENNYRNVIVRTTDVFFNEKPSVLFLLIDITERVASEKIIRESEAKFRILAELTPNAIMIYQDNLWVYANLAASKVCGYSNEEILKMNFLFFVHPDYVDVVSRNSKERLLNNGLINEYEFKIITKNGQEKWVLLNGEKITYNSKDAIIISVIDISKQKAISEELEISKKRAEDSNHLKTAFLNNISHEIRTPLNGILNFGEMIMDPTQTDEDKKMYFDILNQSTDRLLSTINDYMDISLIISNNVNVNPKPIHLDAIIRNIERVFHPNITEKSLDFLIQIDLIDHESMIFDEEIMSKILKHLISNAIKFTPEFGKISIRVKNNLAQLQIEIEDNGTGISEEALLVVFSPFNQEDYSSTRKYEGSGLGLAIVRGYIDLLNGTIDIKSEKNIGTTIIITLPIVVQPKNFTETKILTIGENPNLPILIVEDEVTNRLFMRLLLEKSGYSVVEVVNGKQAVDKIRQSDRFSIILMDIKMPIMDGLEATRQIKAITKSIPIIATTAHAMSGDEQKALDAGCDDYLSKPISKEVLFQKLKKFNLIRPF